MSNLLAIAAATATLKRILDRGLGITAEREAIELKELGRIHDTTSKPPQKVRDGTTTNNQLNLFLYRVEQNAAWHDVPIPGQGRDSRPPLALTLYYLLTAYGENDEDEKAHQLLGCGMQVLADTPTLSRKDINSSFPRSDLHQQIERIHVTPQPMTLDELSKLWSTFQTEYRISAAYQVSVILIESALATHSAMPILRRGTEDQGVNSQTDTLLPFPTIEDVTIVEPDDSDERKTWVRGKHPYLGDRLQLKGHHLSGQTVKVRFSNPRLQTSLNLDGWQEIDVFESMADDSLKFVIPNQADNWPAGIYAIAVKVTKTKTVDGLDYLDEHVSGEVVQTIAPQISTETLKVSQKNPPPPPSVPRSIELSFDCIPTIRPKQRVSVLLGGREVLVPATVHSTPTQHLVIPIPDVMPGEYVVRLRVDGVDSFPIVMTIEGKLAFDDKQKVIVQ